MAKPITQIEGSPKEYETRYRRLFETAQDGILILDVESGEITDVNPFLLKMLGYSYEELLGKKLWKIESFKDIVTNQTSFRKFIQKEYIHYEDLSLKTKDGQHKDVEFISNTYLVGHKQVIQCNIRDITEHKWTEETLKKQSSVVEQTADNVVITDREGVIEYVNPAFEQLTGYSQEEAIGKTPRILKSGLHTAKEYAQLWSTILAGKVLRGVVINRKKNGQLFYEDKTITPLRDRQGNITHFVSTGKDITERKRAEEQIQSRTNDIFNLYKLSRGLANTDSLDQVLSLVTLHAVEDIHSTFARVALLEGNELVIREAYPIRVLGHDLFVGKRTPVIDLPYCQRALKQSEPIILHADDPNLGDDERAALLLDFARMICIMPLAVGGDLQKSRLVLGLLMMGESRSEEREPFTPEKIEMARSIADQAATAVHSMLLREKTQRDAQRFTALHSIDMAISMSLDLHTTLTILLGEVVNLLNVSAADILLLNPHTQVLEYSDGKGFRTNAIEKSRLHLGEGYAGRVALERRILNIPDLPSIGSENARINTLADENFIAYFGIPLIAKDKVIGVLDIFNRSHLTPDSEWLDFMEALAGQAAIAIDNVNLFNDLEHSNLELSLAYDATIEGWSRAMDLRDHDTEGHSQRVAELTVRLARARGLTDEEIVHVRRGALLHDMGKMGVPDDILLKPGPLTDEEWKVMRQHPQYAYDMLSPIAYLRPALDIPYGHHEKWDGTGYPRGLKGEAIPLAARIFTVVDVWDALTTDRPYHKAWSEEKVLKYIKSLAGTHLDPKIVDLFVKMISKDT